jgi:arylsulfatase A-like enzyme
MRRSAVATLCLAGLASVLLTQAPTGRAQTTEEPPDRPNVLIVVTDDQRWDGTMIAMPQTRTLFADGGTTFSNAYVTTPLCCPSRGSIWSGRYAHNHGVIKNGSLAQEQAYDQSRTMQVQLQGSGYTTGIVGKYWNGWPVRNEPPGFTRIAAGGGRYEDANFNQDGVVSQIPGYTTAVEGDLASEMLGDFEADDERPWMMYVATVAPHAPFTAEAQYADATFDPWTPDPAVEETDLSDKPPQVRREITVQQAAAERIAQLRTLRSVDDLVAQLFARLDELGEQDTLAIFTSDNGYMWGDHGLTQKRRPYTPSIQVPLLLRWPGHVAAGATDDRLVANIDIAPTVLEAAGLTPPAEPDGESLFSSGERRRLHLEFFEGGTLAPDWASTLTRTSQYVEWYGDDGGVTFREYYDMAADPWQLENRLADADPDNDPDLDRLAALLASDRVCEGTACPRPEALDTQAPTTPGTPAGVGQPGAVELTWDASTDDVADEITYRVFRDGAPDPVHTITSDSVGTVTVRDDDLAPAGVHTYVVDAWDGRNRSGPSATSEPVTVSAEAPPLFADDFSSGFTRWSAKTNLTLDSIVGHDAPPSARAQVANAKAFASTVLGGPEQSVCMQEAVRYASGTGTTTLMRLRSSTNKGIAKAIVAPTRVLKARSEAEAGPRSTGVTMPSGWATVRLCVTVGAPGSMELFLDATSIGAWSAQLGTAPIARVQILDDARRTFTAHVDDVSVERHRG